MSRARRAIRIVRAAIVACAVLALGGAGAVYGPDLARRADAFKIRRVDVTGTRFLDPRAVIRAAGLDHPASVLDDADVWRTGVLTLPLVESVRTRRSLPGTVTLEVVEVRPLALVAGATLRPVDAAGRLIELEPAGRLLDLPLLSGADVRGGRIHGDPGRAALRVLVRLGAEAPELRERISQVNVEPGTLHVLFRDGGPEALFPLRPTTDQLSQLRLTLADLAARGELDRVRSIDVRFRDQAVVSFLQSPVS